MLSGSWGGGGGTGGISKGGLMDMLGGPSSAGLGAGLGGLVGAVAEPKGDKSKV